MALFKETDFINEIKLYFNTYNIDDEQLKAIMYNVFKLDFFILNDWEDFNKELKNTLVTSFKELKIELVFPMVSKDRQLINIPKYTDANTEELIIQYLDAIKGNNVEENLKRLFINSQLESDKYNYFFCIFNAMKSSRSTKQNKQKFLLCYSVVLLTQSISYTSLKTLISFYADYCTNCLDSSLQAALSSDKQGMFNMLERPGFLRLVFALRIIDYDNIELAIEHNKKLLMTYCNTDGYDPRSFLEMIYYYLLINNGSSADLEKMLITTTIGIINKIFGEYISNNQVAEYVNKWKTPIIKNFLKFDKNSVIKCVDLLKSNGKDVDEENIIALTEERLDHMNVNYFKNDVTQKHRDSNTYDYIDNTVTPRIDPNSPKHLKPDEFCNWMVNQRQYYESYYNVTSKTRFEFFHDISYTDIQPTDIEQYAYEIVQLNSLSVDGLIPTSDFKKTNTKEWKTNIRRLPTEDEKLEAISKYLDPRLDAIDNYKGDGLKALKVLVYANANVERKELYLAILNEIERMPLMGNECITRADYLKRRFDLYADEEILPTEFRNDIDNEMERLRWETFNPMNYHDALLYMCLNCENPKEMFKRITSKEGYSYEQF